MELTIHQSTYMPHLRHEIEFLFKQKLNLTEIPEKISCGLIQIFNLASPSWTTVDCQKAWLTTILCERKIPQVMFQNMSISTDSKVHKQKCILNQNHCYAFHSCNRMAKLHDNLDTLKDVEMTNFQFLFQAVASKFPPIFIDNFQKVLTCKLYINKIVHEEHSAVDFPTGLCVRPVHSKTSIVGGNIFMCNETFISFALVCDGKNDCSHTRSLDELNCKRTTIQKSVNSKRTNLDHRSKCSSLYQCSLDKSILFHLASQSHSNKTGPSIQDPFHLPCAPGQNNSYYVHEICLFKLNEERTLVPCQYGEHLQNCQDFACNMMFKCPKFYCIPWRYVCDSKIDCPNGYDESIHHRCASKKCKYLFRCRQSSLCIHMSDVCNGEHDCPSGDDELLCSLHNSLCPKSCHCLLFTVTCKNVILDSTFHFHSFPVLFVNNCTFVSETFVSLLVQNAVHLNLVNGSLHHMCLFSPGISHIVQLDAGFNKISFICMDCFKILHFVKVILLRNNKITFLYSNIFPKTSLQIVDLSYNRITGIRGYFSGSFSCVAMQHNPNLDVSSEFLSRLKTKMFLADAFALCCYTSSDVKCFSILVLSSSCDGLLADKTCKNSTLPLLLVLIGSSLLSILVQKVSLVRQVKETASYGFIVGLICIADLTFCFVLATELAIHNLYGREFALLEAKWRSHALCFTTGFIVLNFQWLSPALSIYFALHKLLNVEKPFIAKLKTSKHVLHELMILCTVSLVLSSCTVSSLWVLDKKMYNSLCLPQYSFGSHTVLVRIITWFTIVELTAASFLHIGFSLRTILSLNKSRKQFETLHFRLPVSVLFQLALHNLLLLLFWCSNVGLLLHSEFAHFSSTALTWMTMVVTPSLLILLSFIPLGLSVRDLCTGKPGKTNSFSGTAG